jgi:4-hydroxy-3-methylbut-2-en-1-yl diphosphate reductase
VLLAAPRGFCAGVERAIRIVETSLSKFGPPVYVRHQIVHNQHVVARLQRLGAVFVHELDEVPDNSTVIFSAHGVPKSVIAEARRRRLSFLDATCPLVSKVHAEADRHFAAGRHVLLIGHAGHPEVKGTIGQLPPGAVTLIETKEDIDAFMPADPTKLAYVTQTTLSVDDAHGLVSALHQRFPEIMGPHKEDICYATTNRQRAVKSIAASADIVLIIGSPKSSNSMRLVEAAMRAGACKAVLIESAEQIDWTDFPGVTTVAVSAGASSPEYLVHEVIDAIRARYDVDLEESTVTREVVTFNLPRALAM